VKPILVDRYGEGKRPCIEAKGKTESALYLHNVEQIEVRNLELTNWSEQPGSRRGVDIFVDNYGVARHIVVADLYIHDVRGTDERKETGGIIFRSLGNRTPSRFDDLRIERNLIWKVDRSGIAAESYHAPRTHWNPSTGVIIRDNYLSDIGGDGIVPWATERVLVEHNIALHCNSRSTNYNAGIWPWSADNSVFQLNEAAFTHGTKDGQGFDSDYNSKNTLFQYNYSHDNQGGFILLCTPVARDEKENIGNNGTIVRWNVSRNDHNRIFNVSGASAVVVEENAIYIDTRDDVQLVLVSSWDGWSDNVLFQKNRFHVAGTARYGHEVKRNDDGTYVIAPGWGGATNIRFAQNYYIGKNHVNAPQDFTSSTNLTSRPRFADDEPQFDPSKPDGLGKFMQRHRQWLLGMFSREFGQPVKLAR
jgi:hypothetical protein